MEWLMPSRRSLFTAAAVVAEAAVLGTQSGCSPRHSAAAPTPGTSGATGPFVLLAPHPDDETLGGGVLIAEAIAAGRDVHVLLLTRGTGSVARLELNGTRSSRWWGTAHNPDADGYAPLTPDAFGQARHDELTTAVRALGGGQLHEARLTDGSVTVAQAKAAIASVVSAVGPKATVIAPSYVVDDNPDHRAAGQALRELAAEQPAVYQEYSWYVLPRYWHDARLQQVTTNWHNPSTTQISARVRNACRAYAAWHPPASYAIGYHSVDDMFALMDTKPRSLTHK
jgi:LmbE family N-acetylglucosaminyl deacetylase